MIIKNKAYIGIDEVGRGSLAGPVVAAAAYLPKDILLGRVSKKGRASSNYARRAVDRLPQLRDSKRLTSKQRELWFSFVKFHSRIRYALGWVGPKVIDRINIRQATNLAARRALSRLIQIIPSSEYEIIADGGLDIGDDIAHQSINGGDEIFSAIQIASIVAKVSRDRAMRRRHFLYPQYGFDIHKGYGTEKHRLAIIRHGPAAIHRTMFISRIILGQ